MKALFLSFLLIGLASPVMAGGPDCFGSAINDVEMALAQYEREHGPYFKEQVEEYERLQRMAPNPPVTYTPVQANITSFNAGTQRGRVSLTTYE